MILLLPVVRNAGVKHPWIKTTFRVVVDKKVKPHDFFSRYSYNVLPNEELDHNADKVGVLVQCAGFRCLAYQDADGVWRGFFSGTQLPLPIDVLEDSTVTDEPPARRSEPS